MGQRAVVIGAGIAGMVAARALADYFEQVVVCERDILPAQASSRAGTPQDRHTHTLLCGGLRSLEQLYPGFGAALLEAGAVPIRIGQDVRVEMVDFEPCFPRRNLGLTTYSMSRPLVEHLVRERTFAVPNILLLRDCRVRELVAVSDGSIVTAIRYMDAARQPQTLQADLVVDASGRSSLSLALLSSLGIAAPDLSSVGAEILYATAVFAIPGDATDEWKGTLLVADSPSTSLSGALNPIEGGHWIATLWDRFGNRLPADVGGFIDHAKRLRTSTIYDAIKSARCESEVVRIGFRSSEWRHFERLPRIPDGLIILGDAVCRLNPTAGQGMSIAASQAQLLHTLLAERAQYAAPLSQLPSEYFRRLRALLEAAWSMSAMPDLIFPTLQGQRPPNFQQIVAYAAAMNRLAAADPAVHKLAVEVQHLLQPIGVLNAPDIVSRATALLQERAMPSGDRPHLSSA